MVKLMIMTQLSYCRVFTYNYESAVAMVGRNADSVCVYPGIVQIPYSMCLCSEADQKGEDNGIPETELKQRKVHAPPVYLAVCHGVKIRNVDISPWHPCA